MEPEPVKDAAKASALAGLFALVGHFFGALIAQAFVGPQLQKSLEKMFSEWGMNIPQAGNAMDHAAQWGGAMFAGLCCGAFDFAMLLGGGVLVGWIVAKSKK